jgi:hypothetical protein
MNEVANVRWQIGQLYQPARRAKTVPTTAHTKRLRRVSAGAATLATFEGLR